MEPGHVVYLATGREEICTQALYSAWTALAWRGERRIQVHVYTDRPSAFEPLAHEVDVVPLTPERARAWRGPWVLVYRMKAEILVDVARRFPADPVLLADADTYWIGDVTGAFERIGVGSAVMHEQEYFVGTHQTLQMKNFRKRLRRTSFRGKPIDDRAWMWNSGALGLHPTHFHLLGEWIAFMDEVHPSNRKPIVEQFGIAWLLQQRQDRISPCTDLLFHYWNDKDRNVAAIREILPRLRALPPPEALSLLRERPVRVEGPPPPMKKHTLLERLRISIRERLPLKRMARD